MNKKQWVKEWMECTAKTDAEIATLTGCDYEYVAAVREELADEAMAQLAYVYSQGKDRTPPEAEGIDKVLDERGSRYGTFKGTADVAQKIKHSIKNSDNWHKLAPDQKEALDLIATKLGRIVNGNPDYVDSWTDIAGYAKLVADRLEGIIR